MSRAVIVCGAKIKDYEIVSSYFCEGDFFIYCDGGLVHEDRFMSVVDSTASLIVGDFDSHERPDRAVEIIELPREKDDTDSIYAAKEAIKRGFDEILFVGASGDRLDHTLANVYALIYLYENNVKAMVVDDYSELVIIGNREAAVIEDSFEYFSLIAIAGKATGVTIKNAKYELSDGVILPEYQYAVSNEPLVGKDSTVSIKNGYLLLIKDRY